MHPPYPGDGPRPSSVLVPAAGGLLDREPGQAIYGDLTIRHPGGGLERKGLRLFAVEIRCVLDGIQEELAMLPCNILIPKPCDGYPVASFNATLHTTIGDTTSQFPNLAL